MDYIRYTMRIPEKMFIKEVTLALYLHLCK